MAGFVDVITLLLGLSGFGLQPNPKAPTPDASLEYAIADADVVIHFDAASVIPGNYKKLTALADDPQIKASPDLAKLVRQGVTEVDSARGLVKTMTGIDVTTDIADATLFVHVIAQKGDQDVLVAVHGKFSAASLDKIAGLVKKPVVKSRGGASLEVDDKSSVAITSDGVLLFGTRALLAERVRGDWKPPPHGAGTSLSYAAEVLAGKPVFAISLSPSQLARDTGVAAAADAPEIVRDLIKRGKAWSFSLYHDGIGWTWSDSTKAGLESMTDISNGMIDVLRASQIAPRGVAKIALGALESYRGDPRVDELVRHKADVLKVVDSYIGDGSFKAKVDADPKSLKLSVRLTGRSTADVMPLGIVIPLAIGGMLVEQHTPAHK